MEIQSINFDDNKLSIFCNIKSKDDLKQLAFVISSFAIGYLCFEISEEEILLTLEKLFKNIDFDDNTLYTFKINVFIAQGELGIGYKKIAKYKIIEDRKIELINQ